MSSPHAANASRTRGVTIDANLLRKRLEPFSSRLRTGLKRQPIDIDVLLSLPFSLLLDRCPIGFYLSLVHLGLSSMQIDHTAGFMVYAVKCANAFHQCTSRARSVWPPENQPFVTQSRDTSLCAFSNPSL
ncbi:hypothetical protein T4B_5338 [Trichinella pseudospiralis]|uniref:Uncharacterized protein n=1 Tax=Trichinella pseudospiralis TaxID=6337 RepID=A0A0V0XLC0_TRIPS|nr:hypothetical protein T4E_7096 [Trichinella pseudospiralis]KRZ20285.1 hypothetical protein T4B_5338 [Trichinella pseudospiralis]